MLTPQEINAIKCENDRLKALLLKEIQSHALDKAKMNEYKQFIIDNTRVSHSKIKGSQFYYGLEECIFNGDKYYELLKSLKIKQGE